jgi:DNA polymerase III alpha subunit
MAVRRFDKKGLDFNVATFDKHDAEDIGILKMDILGLNTMTIINEANNFFIIFVL